MCSESVILLILFSTVLCILQMTRRYSTLSNMISNDSLLYFTQNGHDECGRVLHLLLMAISRYLGTSPSGLPYVTVITGTHIPEPLSQPEPAVCNTTKKQLAHPREKCHPPPDVKLRSIEGGLSIPADRPTIHLRPGTPPPRIQTHRLPPPTETLPNWPPDWSLQTSPCLDSRKLHRTACPLSLSSTIGLPWPPEEIHTSTRDEAHDAVDNNNPASRKSGRHFLPSPRGYRRHHISPRCAGSSTTDRKTGLRDAPGPAAKGLPPAAHQEMGRGGRGYLHQAGQVLPHDRDGTGHVRPAGAVLPPTVSWI